MKHKLCLLTLTVFMLACANAAVTVTINAPTQYHVADTSVFVTATVGNIIKHDLPYIKAKVLDREIPLDWTGQGYAYRGRMSLVGLPAVDTLALNVTAVGFNNDTVTATVYIIHDLRPKITLLYSPSEYIATPNLRVTATCTSYSGAACQLKILKQTDSTVLATGVDSIDATVNCAPTSKNDTLVIVGIDERNSIGTKQVGYYYETDTHFTPVYVADGPRVGNIVDFNYNNILTMPPAPSYPFYRQEFNIINVTNDSLTVVPFAGNILYNYHFITKKGVIYMADNEGYSMVIAYNNGETFFYGSYYLPLYHRGDNYMIFNAGGTGFTIMDLENNATETIAGNFPYSPNYSPFMAGSISNKKVVGLQSGDVSYFYSAEKGAKNIPAFGLFIFSLTGVYEYYASGDYIFYLSDSSGYFSLNSFDGTTYRKIADVGYSTVYPYNRAGYNLPYFTNTARDGFASFQIDKGSTYITDGLGNAYALEGNFDALGDSGNIATNYLGRSFYNSQGQLLLNTNNRGNAYYCNGSWYVAVSNVLYRLTLNNVLPLHLTSLTGQNKGTANLLTWQTAQEVNTSYFELQHATTTNRNFIPLTTVTAAGNSNTRQNYSYTHTNPETGTNYYRLKMVDKDGKFTFSRIISINNGEATFKAAVLPNLVHNNITLQIQATNTQNVRVDVVNVNGVVLFSKQFTAAGGTSTQNINTAALAKGTYFVRVSGGDSKPINLKVVKQ